MLLVFANLESIEILHVKEWGDVALSMIGVALVSFALLPSVGLAGLLGYLFSDLMISMSLTIFGIYVATLIGILWIKKLCGNAVEDIFKVRSSWHHQYQRIQKVEAKELYKMLVVLRLSPHMPFALTNLAVAQLKLPIKNLTLFSWLGLLPRSLFACYLGHSIENIAQALKVHSDLKLAMALSIFVLAYFIWKWRSLRNSPSKREE